MARRGMVPTPLGITPSVAAFAHIFAASTHLYKPDISHPTDDALFHLFSQYIDLRRMLSDDCPVPVRCYPLSSFVPSLALNYPLS
jgi:hypothetical protein